jgi:ubiquitin carboxyl-terminal hydrolase 10
LNVAQPSTNADGTGLQELEGQENIDAAAVPEVAPAKPKLWTGLFTESGRSGTSKIHPGANVHASGTTTPRSVPGPGVLAPRNGGRGLPKENAEAIIEALRSYRLGSSETYAFVEPRGLINGGNMCYMNSVSGLF